MSAPHELGAMPGDRRMTTVDERLVHAPLARIFDLAADVERWPDHLAHYRYVRFLERRLDGGGTVEMSANRPFGFLNWPTRWTSLMTIAPRSIRYRHIRGITTGMDVEWTFESRGEDQTFVRIVHVWNGPAWPMISEIAARAIIGPVFVHGIASRTLAGLATVSER